VEKIKRENEVLYQFDIVPYLAELISRKESLYKVINSIYKYN